MGMHRCSLNDADLVIDGWCYRFDKLGDFKRFRNLRMKGLMLVDPIRTESRLKSEKTEEKAAIAKERVRVAKPIC
jgi:hypothetical protein